MGGDQNPSQVARGLAAVRAAEALLRTLGGFTVWVRVPSNANSGDTSQLGLQPLATEDVELSPVIVRSFKKVKDSQRRIELSISAASLTRAKDINDAAAAQVFFESALGVVYAKTLWRVVSISVDDFGGTPYLYRLMVTE